MMHETVAERATGLPAGSAGEDRDHRKLRIPPCDMSFVTRVASYGVNPIAAWIMQGNPFDSFLDDFSRVHSAPCADRSCPADVWPLSARPPSDRCRRGGRMRLRIRDSRARSPNGRQDIRQPPPGKIAIAEVSAFLPARLRSKRALQIIRRPYIGPTYFNPVLPVLPGSGAVRRDNFGPCTENRVHHILEQKSEPHLVKFGSFAFWV